MNKTTSTGGNAGSSNVDESLSRRVAEELHARIDQLAAKSESLERDLHDRGSKAQARARDLGQQAEHKAHELQDTINDMTRENPWAVVGGSLLIGFIIGALANRR